MYSFKTYDAIQTLPGMEELKTLAAKLLQTAENLSNTGLSSIPLPNLILAAAPGCGTSLHIRMIADLLRDLNLMQFIGDEDAFEWALTGTEDSFDKLLRRIRIARGFYGQYQGVIGLDLSEVIGEKWPSVSKRLMEYVHYMHGSILFVFVVPIDTSKRTLDQLKASFASLTPVELIRTPFPGSDSSASYVVSHLEQKQMTVAPEAQAIIRSAIAEMLESPAFDGYQTLTNLVDEICWRKFSTQVDGNLLIAAQDVAFLSGPGGYSSLFKSKEPTSKRLVGFGA
ncbi:MAG: hypothetical protein IJD60_00315 [Clostridia bacterium]|nr:hypothetical protein [Clostridia bacterium]